MFMKVGIMRISHYLEIDSKLKSLRQEAKISQKEMASKLGLSVPSYSNYENGYSEPPMEIIESFCGILGLSLDSFFGFNMPTKPNNQLNTYADFLMLLNKMKSKEIPIDVSVEANKDTHALTSTLKIESPQVAALLNGWKDLDDKLSRDVIDSDEYNIWFEDLLHTFKVPIDNI